MKRITTQKDQIMFGIMFITAIVIITLSLLNMVSSEAVGMVDNIKTIITK